MSGSDMKNRLWRTLGVGAKVLNQPDSSLRIVAKKARGGVAPRTQEAANGTAHMVMIDTEVLFSSSGLRGATYGANTTLGSQKRVIVCWGHAVVPAKRGAAVLGSASLRVGLAVGRGPFAFTGAAPGLQVPAALAAAELLSRFGEATARTAFRVLAGGLAWRGADSQALLIRAHTILADRSPPASAALVPVEIGKGLPREAVAAVSAIEQGDGRHNHSVSLNGTIIHRWDNDMLWHVGHG